MPVKFGNDISLPTDKKRYDKILNLKGILYE